MSVLLLRPQPFLVTGGGRDGSVRLWGVGLDMPARSAACLAVLRSHHDDQPLT